MTDIQYDAESLDALSEGDFNRVVAELDGWRIELARDVNLTNNYTWRITTPQGYEYFTCGDDKDHAWEVAQRYTMTRDGSDDVSIKVPRYVTDLNVAWGLPLSDNWLRWVGDCGRGIMSAQILSDVTTASVGLFKREYNAYHENPARALATAWIMWKRDNF